MEVAPGVHRVEAPLGERYVSLYLLSGEEGCLRFDTGTDSSPREALAPYLAELRIDASSIRWVVTSRADFDHFGGNRSQREMAPGAVFIGHGLDATMVEDVEHLIQDRLQEFALEHGIAETAETIDMVRAGTRTSPLHLLVKGGERVRLGEGWAVEIAHVPGHSRGHLSIFDERSRTAIVSDAIFGATLRTKDGRAAFPPTYRHVDAYLATIARVEAWQPSLLLTAHFPVFEGAGLPRREQSFRGPVGGGAPQAARPGDTSVANEGTRRVLGATSRRVERRSSTRARAPTHGASRTDAGVRARWSRSKSTAK